MATARNASNSDDEQITVQRGREQFTAFFKWCAKCQSTTWKTEHAVQVIARAKMPAQYTFVAEYAKSGRSTCKGCQRNIAKDTLRVGVKAAAAHDHVMVSFPLLSFFHFPFLIFPEFFLLVCFILISLFLLWFQFLGCCKVVPSRV